MLFFDWVKNLINEEDEEINFYRVYGADEDVKLPKRATKGSAGYDFFAPKEVKIPSGLSETIWLDIKAKMPNNVYLRMENRSSMMSKHNIMLFCSGIIDSDYYGNPNNDGNIGIRFYNFGEEYTIKAGERICQGIFLNYEVTSDDKTTDKRTGGFGSTGK